MNAPAQRVAVLFGGRSAERDVSLESGGAVSAALRSRGHIVRLIDPVDTCLRDVDWSRFDSAFIALHGTWGEDGGVQRELDELGVVYTGSDADVSALAFDKMRTKQCVGSVNVPTASASLIHPGQTEEEISAIADGIGFPLVAKPNAQGSSVGVSMVDSPEGLLPAVERCFAHDTTGLLETALAGDEWTVGLIDSFCLPPIRVEAARTFYDYQAKYHDDRTGYHVAAAGDSSSLVERLKELSVRACRALGTTGIARADFRLCAGGEPWLLEVNTIPGFTSHSLVPKAAASLGIDLGELCERVLPPGNALRRAG